MKQHRTRVNWGVLMWSGVIFALVLLVAIGFLAVVVAVVVALVS